MSTTQQADDTAAEWKAWLTKNIAPGLETLFGLWLRYVHMKARHRIVQDVVRELVRDHMSSRPDDGEMPDADVIDAHARTAWDYACAVHPPEEDEGAIDDDPPAPGAPSEVTP